MSLVLQSSGGGQITLQEPATASNFTQTLPAATGDVMVSGNMPAFSAYLSGNQTVSSRVFTKVQCNTEEFDTNSNYDTSAYRFTPTVAGYYQVNAGVNCFASTSPTRVFATLYKNGSVQRRYSDVGVSGDGVSSSVGGSIVYLNGTTDYIELFAYIAATTAVIEGVSFSAFFQAIMVRTA